MSVEVVNQTKQQILAKVEGDKVIVTALPNVLTIRDQFAMAALQGLLAEGRTKTANLADNAYHIADLMLAERQHSK